VVSIDIDWFVDTWITLSLKRIWINKLRGKENFVRFMVGDKLAVVGEYVEAGMTGERVTL
jgi:hypothetical protein